jgi:uncharacterized Tic20 family protein
VNYSPTEFEKRYSALVQLLGIVTFFVAPLIGWRSKRAELSPYIDYWTKVCLIWSGIMTLLACGGLYVLISHGRALYFVLILVVHGLMCVLGAFAAYFNLAFSYLMLGEWCCGIEMSYVYGSQMRRRDLAE